MLILQQPRSHIPLYEADYESLRMKQQHSVDAHRVMSHLHVPPAPRAAARVSERLRVKLPVKPAADIVQHDQRVESFVSITPFDSHFPSFPRTKERVVLFSVSPFDSRFPSFTSTARAVFSRPRPVLDSDDKTMEISSFSPFDARFDTEFHRHRRSPQHRRTRNRSFIKKRRILAAVAQYRREVGPVSSRALFDPEDRKIHPVDPSIPSFSPWQEAEFAVHCKIPLPRFVHPKKLKAVTLQAAAILKPRLLKTKKPRYISYSPFNPNFPSFSSKSATVLSKKPASAAAAVIPAAAFPAYSPMAKQQAAVQPGFNLPPAAKAPPAPAAAAASAKLPRQPSLHMH
jgi:hypothetical protein